MRRETIGRDIRLVERLRRERPEIFKAGQRYRVVHESSCATVLPHTLSEEVHCDCRPVLIVADKVFS